jgi:hypothetical protein
MTIKVPLVYKAQATQGRQTTPREIVFGAYFDVELRIAEDAEVPVALRYNEVDELISNNDEGNDVKERAAPRQHEFRIADKQFYQRLTYGEVDSIDLLTDVSPTMTNPNPLVRWSSNNGLAIYRMEFPKFGKGLPMSEDGYRLQSSDRARMERDLQSIADGWLIVNGEVWKEAEYPVLRMEESKSQQWKSITVDVTTCDPFANNSGHNIRGIHRITQLGSLMETAKETLAAHTRPENTYLNLKVSDLEVLIPEAFWFNPDIDDFIAFAEYVLKDDEKSVLRKGREMSSAWHDVHEAASHLGTTRSDDELYALGTSIDRLVELKSRERHPNDTLIVAWANMKRRIENRPIEDVAAAATI